MTPSRIVEVIRTPIVCAKDELESERKRVWKEIEVIREEMSESIVFGFMAVTPKLVSSDSSFDAIIKILIGPYAWEVRNIGDGIWITPEPGEDGSSMRDLMEVLSGQEVLRIPGQIFLVDTYTTNQFGIEIQVAGIKYNMHRSQWSLLIRNLSEPGGPIDEELFVRLVNS